ncbi:MAG: SsrA-binding protein SmpB [candidate division Zixibacteria bacterium]|nr:SsrA-binding protein SmpB [candidate division Zixibacteria bacterium]NIR64872.1 SsrA-binding protein SmpB [candidate division Zixibacteria bacterium]NIS17667.1 SsrA-binding protein SmpB [candidate division Zixibacteria bacterium]NIS46688.1 SsrA-binding protein SmpB [candidate division Zixibacteria bacterium]NIT53985.1 SsrA-binding protein SmpB [candidate division Zixibacteria bacterium]
MAKDDDDIKIVTTNRRAYHDYHISETYEAGIELVGSEVKSIRQGRVSIQEAYAAVEDGEVWVHSMRINPYEQASHEKHDPDRKKRLLLHKREIRKLKVKTQERGFTLIPLRLYFRKNLAKLEIGLARGKKLYDKREAIKKKEDTRRMERGLRERNR